jgi:peroxiredoxin
MIVWHATAVLLCTLSLQAREYGQPIGTKMPEFHLPDQNGQSFGLKELLGPQGTVILFHRSADWCPNCKAQLVELQKNLSEFRKLGVSVVAISYDSPAILRNFAERRGIHFPLLSDANSRLIRQIGILDGAIAESDPYFGIPYPCFFVLDGRGIIVAKHFEEDERLRENFANILSYQFGVAPPVRTIESQGDLVKIEAVANRSLVAAGQRVSLSVAVDLKSDVHIYAPSVKNYIPIHWDIKESSATTARDVRYPAPETVRLEVINEMVPAYRGQFRLRGTITLGNDESLRSVADNSGYFTIHSTLRYQACDKHQCYVPQEIPLQWTFHYISFDRERAPVELQKKSTAAGHRHH